MSDITYRRAVPGDEHSIRARLPLAASTMAVLGDGLRRADRIGVLAEDGVDAVGVVLALAGQDHGHVLDVAVHPDHRRQGIASHMMELTHQAVRAAGSAHVTLECRQSNQAARSLYAELGYVEAGMQPSGFNDLRDGPVEDAVIAWWPAIPDGIPRTPVPLSAPHDRV